MTVPHSDESGSGFGRSGRVWLDPPGGWPPMRSPFGHQTAISRRDGKIMFAFGATARHMTEDEARDIRDALTEILS